MANKTTAEVTIGGEKIEVKKLKAGKFYELQKLFAGIIQTISAKKGAEGNEDQLYSMMYKFPEKTAEIVAFCIGMDKEELFKKAEAEEIPTAFETVLRLNNVSENLKNYVAPMERLMKNMNQKN
jgi:hypothetical protein